MSNNTISIKLSKRKIEFQVNGEVKTINCPMNTKVYPLFAVEFLMEQLKISEFDAKPLDDFSSWEVSVMRS